MRIIQTVNDTIRLLFNPKTEIFTISDFLLVRDVDENFLAQVIEVYDDKFDQEANVAKIKLIYRIVDGKELVPYDNYTPSRECEVAKIKQSEIEKCINLDKETIILGKSANSKEEVKINTNFFNNNCVIFADKFEQTNQIFENFAPRLSSLKNVLIMDFSGSCLVENAPSFAAGENFKLPLSSKTIDYIQQKTLSRAKLETQVVLGDVFEEVKKFLTANDEDYIPFQRFLKVVQAQCKQTPTVELMVLMSWLKKYSSLGIFAKNKREFETFFRSVEKNKITTLDLSNVKTEWQKEFVEFITDKIKSDIFLLIRLNDNNINNDIINSIYLKKKNITFVPSFAYGYRKASHIMEFAQNYVLLPCLNPKRDFTYANFQIQALNSSSYMIFGEDTKDFIFVMENETKVKKKGNKDEDDKDKLFISLNLQLEDMTPLELRPNDFEVKQVEPRKKRLHEEISLKDVLSGEEQGGETLPVNYEEPASSEEPLQKEETNQIEAYEAAPAEETYDAPTEITEEPVEDAPALQEEEAVFGEDELDFFEQEEIEPVIEGEVVEEAEIEPADEAEVEPVEEVVEETEIEPAFRVKEDEEPDEDEAASLIDDAETEELKPENKPANDEPKIKGATDKKDTNEFEALANAQAEDAAMEETQDAVSTIIDEVVQENIEDKVKSEETSKKLDEINEEGLKQIENKDDIDKKFDEILNEDMEENIGGNVLKINEKVEIDLNKIKKEVKSKENKLPIFDDSGEEPETPPVDLKEGDKITHEKYGAGEIIKVIKYGTRCLLQIEFEEVGKRLLDPKIAKLKLLEEV